jgi:hypothetical protein
MQVRCVSGHEEVIHQAGESLSRQRGEFRTDVEAVGFKLETSFFSPHNETFQ